MPRQWSVASDAELLDACRGGLTDAFSVVWERHHRAGRLAARNIAPGLDADDLVSEAYLKIFELVKRGLGPLGAFRPYLYQTIRSVAVDRLRSPEQTSADLDEIPDLTEAGPWEDNAFDLNATAKAFSTLNERWQAVLWYTEVEGLPPREVALLLGISANGVSALAGRAREALQSAWVEAHVDRELAAAECQSTLERLQRYERGKLTAGASREVAAHLDECESCAAAAREHRALNTQLALVLATLFLGGAAAAALIKGQGLALGAGQAAAAQASPVGAPGTEGAAGAGGAGATGAGAAATGAGGLSAGATVLAVAASAVAALAIAGGVLLTTTLLNNAPESEAAQESEIDQIVEMKSSDEAEAHERENPGTRTSAAQDAGDEQVSEEERSAAWIVPGRGGNGDRVPVDPAPPVGPAPPIDPAPPVDPVPPVDPGLPVDPGDGSDPALLPGFTCSYSGSVFEGIANEYGVLLLRLTPSGGTPVEVMQDIFDPAMEGTPGNVFSGGVFDDPWGNTFDFGFFTGAAQPALEWWGPDPTTLPVWGTPEFTGLGIGDVLVEMRLVSPDGRYSPWTVIDMGITC